MGDIWLIVFVVALPGAAILWMKGKTRWLWLGCILGMMAVLGGCEAYCVVVDADHKTLSQRFYALPDLEALLISGAWILGWAGLLLHLNWKRITKLFSKGASGSASTDQPTHNEAKKGDSI